MAKGHGLVGRSNWKSKRSWAMLGALLLLVALRLGEEALGLDGPQLWGSVLGLVLTTLFLLIAAAWFVRSLVQSVVEGVHCPRCGSGRMSRERIVSFGPRLFRCRQCGRHWTQLGLSDWEEVEPGAALESDRVTCPVPVEPASIAEDSLGSPAISALVREQRRRKAPQ
jgi:hypothetical protein